MDYETGYMFGQIVGYLFCAAVTVGAGVLGARWFKRWWA